MNDVEKMCLMLAQMTKYNRSCEFNKLTNKEKDNVMKLFNLFHEEIPNNCMYVETNGHEYTIYTDNAWYTFEWNYDKVISYRYGVRN